MVSVRMLTTVAGVGILFQAGEIYELDPKLAKQFLTEPKGNPRAEPVARMPMSRRETRAAA